MKKIVIIGAGQLGSRHLQGIAQSKLKISIEIVDPFEQSRVVAKQRFEEIENSENIISIDFYKSISELSDKLDVVIVATNSDIRTKVVNELLSTKEVDNLILEKVLFQRVEEYHNMEKLLRDTKTSCWVNHPRRMFPFYKKLKSLLTSSTQISYSYQGGDWGLGCNALHFIDHLSYLVDSTNLTIDNRLLDKEIYNSKREGFVEFNGMLVGKIDNHIFNLYSNKEFSPSIFNIISDVININIDELNGVVTLARKDNDWKEEVIKEKIVYFQSELSNIIIEDILEKSSCDLPTYSEAMKLHIPFIKSLLEHMNTINSRDNKLCPIT